MKLAQRRATKVLRRRVVRYRRRAIVYKTLGSFIFLLDLPRCIDYAKLVAYTRGVYCTRSLICPNFKQSAFVTLILP